MFRIRKSKQRGYADYGWLKTHHSFSFADYYDPHNMGFSVLRVINEDFIAPQTGFPLHGHRNMEIITYMLSGSLQHTDSMGNSELLRAGEVQRMSAGRGVRHSEANVDKSAEIHLLQIWLLPETNEAEPGYEQKSFAKEIVNEDWVLIASPQAELGSLKIHQDVKLWALQKTQKFEVIKSGFRNRNLWLQLIEGELQIKSGATQAPLEKGDGLAISDFTGELSIASDAGAHFLLFDMK